MESNVDWKGLCSRGPIACLSDDDNDESAFTFDGVTVDTDEAK